MKRWLAKNRWSIPRRVEARSSTISCFFSVQSVSKEFYHSGSIRKPVASSINSWRPQTINTRAFASAASDEKPGPENLASATVIINELSENTQEIDAEDDSTENHRIPYDDTEQYNFRGKLNNWYRSNFDVSLKDSFETAPLDTAMVDLESPSLQLWTSTFVCPITGHRIEAGQLRGSHFKQMVDKRAYYPSKKLANQAAAMKAVFQFCPEDEMDDSKKAGRKARSALQLWYMQTHKKILSEANFVYTKKNKSGKKSGGTWWTAYFICPVTADKFPTGELGSFDSRIMEDGKVWYRTKTDSSYAAAMDALSAKTGLQPNVPDSEGDDDTPKALSRDPLRHWYQRHHDVELRNTDFVVSTESWKGSGGNRWTASFICPVTGNRYDSGSLRNLPQLSSHRGANWYKRKEDSIVAAALLAFDHFNFTETGTLEPRFCQEDPSELNRSENNTIQTSALNCDQIVDTIPSDTGYSNFEMAIHGDVGDGEDDYVVEVLPRSVAKNSNAGMTTLDLVAQTWIETVQLDDTDLHSRNTASTLYQLRFSAVERAQKWVGQQLELDSRDDKDRTQFDDPSQSSGQRIAKMLLESMALSQQQIPTSREISGTDKAAKSIIDFLNSSSSSAPDSDCYAFYIQCLEGPHHSVLTRATKIYESMAMGTDFEGHRMPPATISVFNSLIRRRAEGGIKTELSELDGIGANRETYLSCLSAIAHSSGSGGSSFDNSYILECIEQMKASSTKGLNGSFAIGIDVLNAPMRWSGGALSFKKSRPYSRCVPWDDIGAFGNAQNCMFKPFSENDPLVKEAFAIDNWLRSISAGAFGSGVRPNIETFESVIQAWIRTRTRKGLSYAEEVIDLIIDNEEIRIRPQTLHPIIALSAHSGDRHRVDKWIKRLEEKCGPEFVDSRLRVAQILSRAVEGGELPKTGAECFEMLETLLDEARDNDFVFVDVHAFTMTILAWYNEGRRKEESISASFSGIQKTVTLFDNLVSSLNTLDDKTLVHRQHCAKYAPMVYGIAVGAIKDLETETVDDLVLESIDWIERMIRRSEEHKLLAPTMADIRSLQESDERLLHDDEYEYNFEKAVSGPKCRSWEEFYDLITKTVTRNSLDSKYHKSEMARLFILLSGLLQKSTKERAETGRYTDPIVALNKLLGSRDPIVAHLVETNLGAAGMQRSSDEISQNRNKEENSHLRGNCKSIQAQGSGSRRRRKARERRNSKAQRRPRKFSHPGNRHVDQTA